MNKKLLLSLTTLLLVLAISAEKGFSQEQIVLNSSDSPIVINAPNFTPVQDATAGFIDLVDLRSKCGAILVKVTAWVQNSSPTTTSQLGVRYQEDDASTVDTVVDTEVHQGAARTKLSSDWVDLLKTVPAAQTENLGYLSLSGKTTGGSASIIGSTIILKCVPPSAK